MDKVISELVSYGMLNGLITEDDKVYVINRLLELFDKKDFVWSDEQVRPIHLILEDMMNYAIEQGIMEDDTITTKDLFDTKIMGLITPMPSQVREKFQRLYSESSKLATDYYYKFSQDTNYIRRDRIEKDEKWTTDTEYGQIDITINLSKPEKDPRDIAKAATAKKNEYPKCLLCEENEGYAGHISHPARQNHRIIPVKLADRDYYFQYSPYVYYNEHCIVFNKEHTPMKIDKLKKMAKLYCDESGITMIVYSDLCGMQLYTGNFLDGVVGKGGIRYEEKVGICFETQYYPNACNEDHFPSSVLKAGQVYKSRTIYELAVS